MIDTSQHAAELLVECYTALRDGLATDVAAMNVELSSDGISLVLESPVDGALQAREEASPSAGVLPQFESGVWVSVDGNEEMPMLGGESVAIHNLEVITFLNCQDTNNPDDESPGTAANGYIAVNYLARAADVAIRSRVPTCAGVYLIRVVSAAEKVDVESKLPSVHAVKWTYEAYQYVRTPAPS